MPPFAMVSYNVLVLILFGLLSHGNLNASYCTSLMTQSDVYTLLIKELIYAKAKDFRIVAFPKSVRLNFVQ